GLPCGSSWQKSQPTPSAAVKFCMTATTCGRVQSLGSTLRFFGASCAGACANTAPATRSSAAATDRRTRADGHDMETSTQGCCATCVFLCRLGRFLCRPRARLGGRVYASRSSDARAEDGSGGSRSRCAGEPRAEPEMPEPAELDQRSPDQRREAKADQELP